MDSKLDKWIRWLEVIHDDIQKLVINRNIFWEVQKIIEDNKRIQKPSSFYNYLGDTYVAYVAIGIRRQIKIGAESISFAKLLSEISKNPTLLSRTYYKSLYKNTSIESHADRHFDNISGGKGKHVSVEMVKSDLEELKQTVLRIEDFSDKRIAHHDRRKPKKIPTFSEVDKSLDMLEKLYVKYHLLFHATSMTTLLPTYQYDWKEIFIYPWLPKMRSDK